MLNWYRSDFTTCDSDAYLVECWPIEADEADRLRCVMAVPMLETDVTGDCWPRVGLFFQGWNPLPTAASASGGGDLFDNLLHWAANIANGVPRSDGWSWKLKYLKPSIQKIGWGLFYYYNWAIDKVDISNKNEFKFYQDMYHLNKINL